MFIPSTATSHHCLLSAFIAPFLLGSASLTSHVLVAEGPLPGVQDLALGNRVRVVGATLIPCWSSPPVSKGSVGLGRGTSRLAKPIARSG